ncbi:hypothetical protein PA6761_00877 [Pseudomonas aeruginosa]
MTQRLFVTGLSGFVGKHLQAYLAAAHTPWALLPVPHRYDLLEPDSLGDLWPELPDAVIHLAGQTYVPEAFRDPARTLQINLLGTLNLLQALKARGFSGTFLYISSGDVYGQVAEAALPIHEELIPTRAIPMRSASWRPSRCACSGVSPKAGGCWWRDRSTISGRGRRTAS